MLPPDVDLIAVNKYIISIISYLNNCNPEPRKFPELTTHFQPDFLHTTISLSFMFVSTNFGYIYCFGRLTKRISARLMVFCRKWLHLVTTFQEGGSASTILREATLQIISDAQCSSAYANIDVITARMICAGVTGGSQDACQVTGSW